MSKHGTGRRNVRLPVAGDRQGSHESITCTCGATIGAADFGTDAIGRLMSTCPQCGRCERVVRVTTSSTDVTAVAGSDPSLAPRKGAWRNGSKHYEPRSCARPKCGATFMPKAGNQRFCSLSCGGLSAWDRRRAAGGPLPNRTLGAAQTVGRGRPKR